MRTRRSYAQVRVPKAMQSEPETLLQELVREYRVRSITQRIGVLMAGSFVVAFMWGFCVMAAVVGGGY